MPLRPVLVHLSKFSEYISHRKAHVFAGKMMSYTTYLSLFDIGKMVENLSFSL